MDTVELNVKGMTCGGCVRSVERVLQALPGVGAVTVSLDDARASVSFDPSRVSREAMAAAIDAAGFEAS